jgi:GNAT superfamily N-acetyltransferase
MDITIRDARSSDTETIARFNSLMALESEHKLLDPAIARAGAAAALADLGKGRYFIAENDGQPIGQLMITYEWSDWRNGVFWWIQSVYVAEHARRTGVFTALFRHLEALAKRTAGVCGIRLYVERENVRAQKTYEKCGLVDAGYTVMEVDYSGAVLSAKETNDAR